MADALDAPFRAFASAWDPQHTADSTAPLPEMQFKHMAKFMRQAGLLEDNFTQLELVAEFRQRCGGIDLNFEEFRAMVRDLAERQHAPLVGVQALKQMLSKNIIRWGMTPKLMPADELTCDAVVHNELHECAGLIRALFERYATLSPPGQSEDGVSQDEEAEGRQIMAGNAGDTRPKMSAQGLLSLATDFQLLPAYGTEQDVSIAAREAVALGNAAKMATTPTISDGMCLVDFIDALVVLADRMFDVRPLDTLFRSTADRVREMLGRIVLQYESVCQCSIQDVLPGIAPSIATFPKVVRAVPQFANYRDQISAIFRHHEERPGLMGVAGFYKLVRECGLLNNTVTMARVQQLYTAATGVSLAEIKAAKAAGQLLGMSEQQFIAALVYLAAYVYITSREPMTKKTQLLLGTYVLPRGGSGLPDPTLDAILETEAVDALSQRSEELRRVYLHFAALYEGQDLVATTAKTDRTASLRQLQHAWEVEDETDNSSLSLTEFNEFARQCELFPEILSSSDCKRVFTSALADGSYELTFPQFVEAIGRVALLEDEVIATPSSLRICKLFQLMRLDIGDTVTPAKAGTTEGEGAGDSGEEPIDRVVPVDQEELRSHLINITEETFAVADNPLTTHKSGTSRTESEKWNDLHSRNEMAIRSRPPRRATVVASAGSVDTSSRAEETPAPRQHKIKSVPAADAGVSKHISGPKMVAPAKKESAKQKIDWSERGDKGKVMIEGTGKVSNVRPASAPTARQAWEEVTSDAAHTSSAPQSQSRYRPAAMVTAGGAAAALGLRSAAVRRARGTLAAQEPLCLIHEMIYCPQCPYPDVMEEVEYGFAAHQFGDCETALQCYEDAYGMWVDACVEDTGCDVHPEVKVFLLNAIGMVHQSAGRPEDTLAAFLDAKSEGNNLDPRHPDVALSMSNIGAAYYRLGSIDMAIEFYDQAIAIRESTLGKRHVDTALLYNNKACCLSLLGDTTATRALLYTAHEVFADGLGATHPRTFASLRNVKRASRLQLDVDRRVGRLPRRDLTSVGLPNKGEKKAGKSKKGKGKGKKGKGGKGGKGKRKKKK